MSWAGPSIVYRRFRAPQNHGEVFADPPLADVPQLVAANRAEFTQCRFPWCSEGQSRQSARRELIQLAVTYTRQYRDVSLAAMQDADPSILMAGHQPQLFHPGVWYKNFELARLAASVRAVPINLMIDNDAIGRSAIRVPAGSIEQPRIENVSYDTPAEQIPFEEHSVADRSQLETFAERVASHLSPFVPHPILPRWWPSVLRAAKEVKNLGQALARARHQLEGKWGLQTLELPLSRICETDAFRRWMMHILLGLPRFQHIYNTSLQEYRRVNHVRSRAHPAPELLADGAWFEAPFWLWTREQPTRGRLFVRRTPGQIELSDRGNLHFTLPISETNDLVSAVDGIMSLAESGVKLRPRALATTLYVRLGLSDLFIHGIGGGKYDQLTDALMQQLYGVKPPHFLVLTATAKLPIPAPHGSPAELRRTDFLLRDLKHNPDRHVNVTDRTRPLVESKRHWLTSGAPDRGKQRHDAIVRANHDLQPFIASQRIELLAQRERLSTLIRNDRILGARDYAFCLFPESTLQALLLDKT